MPRYKLPENMDDLEYLRFIKRQLLTRKTKLEKKIRGLNWGIAAHVEREEIKKRKTQKIYRESTMPNMRKD